MALATILIAFWITAFGFVNPAIILDVTKHGAVGDGKINDSGAFLKAWTALCTSSGDATLQIPKGKTFLLQPVTFEGPCTPKSVRVEVRGSLTAPRISNYGNCQGDSWLTFSNVNGLILSGSGALNGQGAGWWINVENNNLGKCRRPTALRITNCNNLQINGLTHVDSPRNHISISDCNGVDVSNLRIIAPDLSPNTDGINVASSNNVHIHDSFIGTGDDCVAVNGGCTDIRITRIACGPGHGISVGSLGADGATETVEGVLVKDCKFTKTQNGARIKTWVGGSGFAKRIAFEQITLVETKNPIIIDQNYIDENRARDKSQIFASSKGSSVEVSDVTFSGIRGTSATEEAISLRCATGTGCTNIKMNDISITSAGGGKPLRVICENAHGTSGAANPAIPCLSGGKI